MLGDVLDVEDLGQLLEGGALPACSVSSARTASVISRRPPYPTATFTSRPSTSAVDSAATLSRSAILAGSRSSAPTGCSRQRRCSASVSTASMMIPSNGSSSRDGRFRLSVESSHKVTTSTPISSHQPSMRLDVGGARAMTLGRVGPDGLGPSPVAVEHHADVLREPLGGKAAVDPRLVRRIEQPSQPSFPVHHAE